MCKREREIDFVCDIDRESCVYERYRFSVTEVVCMREREREGEREIQTLICSICDRERVLRHMSRYL